MITTKSARVAIIQATNNGWESREAMAGGQGAAYDTIPQVLHGLDCGRVLAAVDACEPGTRDWLLTAYAAEGYPGKPQALVRCEARVYQLYTVKRTVRSETPRMLKMARAVIDDYAHRLLGAPSRAPGWYAEVVGFAPNNWGTWLRCKQEMESIIDEWDRRGLGRVRAVLEPLQEAEGVE